MLTRNQQNIGAVALVATGILILPAVFAQVQPQTGNAQVQPQAGNGRQIFDSRCAGCHTVGGGARVGPDLSIVRNWPAPAVRKNVERMQAKAGPLSPKEVDALVTFLTAAKSPTPGPMPGNAAAPQAAGTGRACPQPGPGPTQTAGPGDWGSMGAQLYSGRMPFANGGMACIACHTPQGSGSAPSLGEIAEEHRGVGLFAFLQRPENRAMRQAYAGHPITFQEAQALSNYFASLGRGGGRNGFMPRRWRGGEGEGEGDDDD